MAVASKIEFLGPNRDGEPRRFTVASGTLIEKGSLLIISGARTAAKHAGVVGNYIAGVALAEKSATDYTTSISAITQAIATFTASGTILAGQAVKSSNFANSVEAAVAASGQAVEFGYAVSDATGNEVEVRINL